MSSGKENEGLTPAVDGKGKPITCYWGDCEKPAYQEFGVPCINGNEMLMFVHCSWQHQALTRARIDGE